MVTHAERNLVGLKNGEAIRLRSRRKDDRPPAAMRPSGRVSKEIAAPPGCGPQNLTLRTPALHNALDHLILAAAGGPQIDKAWIFRSRSLVFFQMIE